MKVNRTVVEAWHEYYSITCSRFTKQIRYEMKIHIGPKFSPLLSRLRILWHWFNLHKKRLLVSMFLVCSLTAFWKVYHEEMDRVHPVNVREIPDSYSMKDNLLGAPADWLNTEYYCDVKCSVGVPCEYKDEVALRIIVLTYKRRQSLKKCLDSILTLDTDGDRISVEIWIDRSKDDVIDHETVLTAQEFYKTWMHKLSKGRACIHLQSENAFISGQWVNTWRPKKNTNELALIVEDDVSLSKHAYKWLKATHAHFGHIKDIAGYTLQMEEINFFAPVNFLTMSGMMPLKASAEHKVFLYPVIGTWGYIPHPAAWRKFQDWYHSARPDMYDNSRDLITPNVLGIVPNVWYTMQGATREGMWEMWHIKFAHDYRLFTVYSNLKEYLGGREDVCFSSNRKEKGLHFNGETQVDNTGNLLSEWKDTYVDYTGVKDGDLVRFNYDGSVCDSSCCFSTKCRNVFVRLFNNRWTDVLKLFIPFL